MAFVYIMLALHRAYEYIEYCSAKVAFNIPPQQQQQREQREMIDFQHITTIRWLLVKWIGWFWIFVSYNNNNNFLHAGDAGWRPRIILAAFVQQQKKLWASIKWYYVRPSWTIARQNLRRGRASKVELCCSALDFLVAGGHNFLTEHGLKTPNFSCCTRIFTLRSCWNLEMGDFSLMITLPLKLNQKLLFLFKL